MRKNTEKTIAAWNANKSATFPSISTDGTTIFSYNTAVATTITDTDGTMYYIVNVSHYSATTSQQVNAILSKLPRFFTIKVSNLTRGITGEQLADIGRPITAVDCR